MLERVLFMGKFLERYNARWTDDSLKIINTPSQFAKDSLFYIQEIGDFKTLPDYFTERSHMRSFLMIYTTKGRGALCYADKTYPILPGTILFIDCMEHHEYYTDGDDWEFLFLHFHGATSEGYYREFSRTHEPVVALSPYTAVPSNIKALMLANKQQTIRGELLSSRIIVNILTDLLCSVEQEDDTEKEVPPLIADVSRYIDNRFNEDITLDKLSKEFSLSKFHLAREFKKYIGFAPGEYLIRCRMNEAKSLLKNTNLPVSEIAKRVGMENESHFSSLFRRKVDMTPRQFRKTWNNFKIHG